ncbi:hypothetical protein Tco_0037770 [Tanacetum coccineum]
MTSGSQCQGSRVELNGRGKEERIKRERGGGSAQWCSCGGDSGSGVSGGDGVDNEIAGVSEWWCACASDEERVCK